MSLGCITQIAYLNYHWVFFGVAVATVILPNLSRHHASESTKEYSQTLDWALKMILLVAVPAAVALTLLAEPIFSNTVFTMVMS